MDSKILKWDSEFFGFNVAVIKSNMENENLLADEIKKYLDKDCRLIYIYSSLKLDLSNFNAILTDKKRSYLLQDPQYKETEIQITQVNENPSKLYSLAFQAGEYSRYKIDPNIREEDFKRLYKLWVDNSISHQFADYVCAAKVNNNYRGFITAKVKDSQLSIGLIATDFKYRGQGIGGALMQEIINIASIQKLQVEVTTQSDNKAACEFYEHKGFKVDHQEYVYHVWSSNNKIII